MAWLQGSATLWLRGDQLVIVAASIVVGARRDWRGLWSGLTTPDFEAFCHRLSWQDPDSRIGAALRAALKASRLNVPVPVAWEQGIGSDKADFDLRLAGAFGSRDARRLYPGMRQGGVTHLLGSLLLSPSRRRHGGQFEGFQPAWQDQHQDVTVRFWSPDAALGAAVRLCLERCL